MSAILGKHDQDMSELERNVAFVMICPDGFQRGVVTDLIDYYTKRHNARIIGARLKYLMDYELELFYRYTFRERIIRDYFSYWWLINRVYSGFPCLALILYCDNHEEETFCDTVLRYKGSHSIKCEPVDETVRDKFGGIGPILSVIHSADDFESLQREALLFFNTDELKKVFLDVRTTVSPDSIKTMIKPLAQDSYQNFRHTLLLRLYATLQMYYPESRIVDKTLCDICRDDIIDVSAIESIESQYSNDPRVLIYFEIIKSLYLNEIFDFKKDYKFQLRKNNLLLSDWEELLLLNYMSFYGKTHQKIIDG